MTSKRPSEAPVPKAKRFSVEALRVDSENNKVILEEKARREALACIERDRSLNIGFLEVAISDAIRMGRFEINIRSDSLLYVPDEMICELSKHTYQSPTYLVSMTCLSWHPVHCSHGIRTKKVEEKK